MPRSKPPQNQRFAPLNQKRNVEQVPNSCFFMVAATATYLRDGEDQTQKQRNVNVLIESDTPNISKAVLDTIHRTILQRLHAELGLQPTEVKDVFFLNIILLGVMPPETFHGHELEADSHTPH